MLEIIGPTVAESLVKSREQLLAAPAEGVYQCESLGLLEQLASGILDLVYLDPPYFTQRKHNAGKAAGAQEGGELSFSDQWPGRPEYLQWLARRLEQVHRVLKPTGSLLLHLDWHAVHYAKVLCDGIFGDECFQNELIWYYQTGGASKERFSRKHDTILFYSRSDAFYFDGRAIAIPRTPAAMARARNPKGARISADNTHKNPDDVLVVPARNPMAKERTGYPTQKPLALMEKLILALTPPGGWVGDFCCGSGTTLVAAKALKRHYLGSDVSAAAVALARERLAGN